MEYKNWHIYYGFGGAVLCASNGKQVVQFAPQVNTYERIIEVLNSVDNLEGVSS